MGTLKHGAAVGGSSLEGKVVAITGASAGIGRATAREFARRGADVGLIARGEERLAAARDEVARQGRRACVAPADVADAAQVERAAERIESELGPIDVWVNVAMTAVLAEVSETEPEEFLRVMQVTYLGSVHGTQAALRRMLPRDRGVIVQVGSALSRRGIPLQATYCGAKHAVKGFLDSLRPELLHRGSRVKVTLVQLPGLNTPQFDWVRTRLRRHPQPVAPIYQPEVAARAIAWAAEHPRREIWVGLPTVYTILGEKFVSGLMDRYPRVQIIVPHLGGVLPYLVQRVDDLVRHSVGRQPPGAQAPVTEGPPSRYYRRLWYDTVNSHPAALRCACESFGADRLLLGTDYPYVMGPSWAPLVRYVEESGLPRADIDGILGGNAQKLLGVSPS